MYERNVKLINGDEQDAFSKRARQVLSFEAGERAETKKRYRRRCRKQARGQIREEV